MTTYEVCIDYGDKVEVVLPDGRIVLVALNYTAGPRRVPELSVQFPITATLNCFDEPTRPAWTTDHGPHILRGKQIIVPMPDMMEQPVAMPRPVAPKPAPKPRPRPRPTAPPRPRPRPQQLCQGDPEFFPQPEPKLAPTPPRPASKPRLAPQPKPTPAPDHFDGIRSVRQVHSSRR